jgi:hypothetical protein
VLQSIALRHQIAVPERSRTRRPCFRRIDRLLFILLLRWWPQWRENLKVQAETVLHWRRNRWASLWRYQSSGHWGGGRPRASSELRGLIARIVGENFLWGAPQILSEVLKLGFGVARSAASRDVPHQAHSQQSRGRPFFAIKPVLSVKIARNGR